ncbi:MAG: hypothetical protein ACK5I7_07940, partial [Anaerotignum sp.]
ELKERFESPYCTNTPWETLFETLLAEKEASFEKEEKANLLDQSARTAHLLTIEKLISYQSEIKRLSLSDKDDVFLHLKSSFAKEVEARQAQIDLNSAQLENTFLFLEEAFGIGQEMVIFVTELTTNFYTVNFISENGSEKYYQYNKELLFEEKQKSILKDINSARAEGNLLF